MKKDQLIKLSKKLSNYFPSNTATGIYKDFANDSMFNDFPIDNRSKIILAFLISLNKNDEDPELYFNEIDNNLFRADIHYIDEKDSEYDCPECGGGGSESCSHCVGDGFVFCDNCDGDEDEPCSICDGVGELPCDRCDEAGEISCEACFGEGYVVFDDSATVSIFICYSWNKEFYDKFELMEDSRIEPETYLSFVEDDERTIVTWDFETHFYEYEYEWTLEDDAVLDNLTLI